MESLALFARLLHWAHFNKPKEADKWMSKLVENNPKISEAHRLRGDYLLATHQFEEALEGGHPGERVGPRQRRNHRAGGPLQSGPAETRPGAQRLAEHGIQLNPDLPLFYLILSSVIQSAEPNIPEKADARPVSGWSARPVPSSRKRP